MRIFKIKVSGFGGDELLVSADCKHDRYGFTHRVTGQVGCQEFTAKARWVNRTWEVYTYQTALHNLCDRMATWKFGAPSVGSLYRTKKWGEARKFAENMKAEFDKAYKGCW